MNARPYFIASGPVRGDCGHRHKTLAAAQACADRDARAIASTQQRGSLTRAYSDRSAYAVDADGTRYQPEETLGDY